MQCVLGKIELMEKKIATRILVYDPVKKSVLAIHPTGRPWKSKGGGIATGVFNIPGGEIDPGESKEACLLREIKEECNLDLDKAKLQYLGFYTYSDWKDLHFYFYPEDNLDLSKLKCESYFETEDGKMLPEVNGFSQFNLESELNMFFPILQKVLKKVIGDYPELFE